MYTNDYNTYPRYQVPQQNYSYQRPQPQLPQGLKGRPVSSVEEVRAIPIDFDGSLFFFPDIANKRIYTKQINADGTASLNMYELKEIPDVVYQQTPNNYVTREEFNEVINKLLANITPQQTEVKLTDIKPF